MLNFISGYSGDSDYPPVESLAPTEKMDYLWLRFQENDLDPVLFNLLKEDLVLSGISDKLRYREIQSALTDSTLKLNFIISKPLSDQEALRIASDMVAYKRIRLQLSPQNTKKVRFYRKKIELAKVQNIDHAELKNLLVNTPDYASYNNGEFKDTLKLMLICRNDRNYPCLFLMKNIFDQYVRNDDNSLWHQPALALSSRGLPYNITNGQTPTGVHMLNSVMPEANAQRAFGKFRRVILDWVPTEDDMTHFLPPESLGSLWWNQASIARDVGRLYLRIHGTGRTNRDSTLSYYPHVPTAGCISTLEGRYDEVDYRDQRVILDKMMESMQMAPVYSNEINIKGILYVVNIDDKQESVTLEDLLEIGIK